MADVGIRELLEAGVHFGHQTRRWNPKMRRFIYGERGGIYIIDLLKTQTLIEQAHRLLQIDDVDPGALAEDEAAHLRVPPAGLVAEVHAGLEQLAHRGRGHGSSFSRLRVVRPAGRAEPDQRARHHPRDVSAGVGVEGRTCGRVGLYQSRG